MVLDHRVDGGRPAWRPYPPRRPRPSRPARLPLPYRRTGDLARGTSTFSGRAAICRPTSERDPLAHHEPRRGSIGRLARVLIFSQESSDAGKREQWVLRSTDSGSSDPAGRPASQHAPLPARHRPISSSSGTPARPQPPSARTATSSGVPVWRWRRGEDDRRRPGPAKPASPVPRCVSASIKRRRGPSPDARTDGGWRPYLRGRDHRDALLGFLAAFPLLLPLSLF
ncbi:hypothetical protein PVAP13_8KG134801 [Panicum virgatum]|uniref:Uncharacterized protein n=1 Tax=Panicum virgatum TaxID=38727 RepID=A0A8T0PPL1_PANVG|nr:hypothetical protein PVAP13_8KG134801 [Panicum virgatum]